MASTHKSASLPNGGHTSPSPPVGVVLLDSSSERSGGASIPYGTACAMNTIPPTQPSDPLSASTKGSATSHPFTSSPPKENLKDIDTKLGCFKTSWIPSGPGLRQKADAKVIGLGRGTRAPDPAFTAERGGSPKPASTKNHQFSAASLTSGIAMRIPPEGVKDKMADDERIAREKAETRSIVLMVLGGIAAVKVFCLYLITLDSALSCALSVGLTIHWCHRLVSK